MRCLRRDTVAASDVSMLSVAHGMGTVPAKRLKHAVGAFSRLEASADAMQKFAHFLAEGMDFRFVDQLQHGRGVHE